MTTAQVKPRFDPVRIDAANAVLAMFASDSKIVIKSKVLAVQFPLRKKLVALRWQVRGGQDFYPVWSDKWAHGGTACTALSQLIRWIKGRPVLPMGSWRYWARVGLGRPDGLKMLELLKGAGYPENTPCVLCGRELDGTLDWWNLDGVSGPCCAWTEGCRQKKPEAS